MISLKRLDEKTWALSRTAAVSSRRAEFQTGWHWKTCCEAESSEWGQECLNTHLHTHAGLCGSRWKSTALTVAFADWATEDKQIFTDMKKQQILWSRSGNTVSVELEEGMFHSDCHHVTNWSIFYYGPYLFFNNNENIAQILNGHIFEKGVN